MKMHRNRYWLIFLAILTCIVTWYCGNTLYRIYRYSQLTQTTLAEEVHWVVIPLSGDQYILKATYSYALQEKRYLGETSFNEDIFMNQWAAEQAIPKYAYRQWNVWFNPRYFSYSTLQKKFPTKECCSAAVLFLLLLYFVGLGFYVNKD